MSFVYCARLFFSLVQWISFKENQQKGIYYKIGNKEFSLSLSLSILLIIIIEIEETWLDGVNVTACSEIAYESKKW